MSRRLDSFIKSRFGHIPSRHLLAVSFGLMLLATTLITTLWLSRSSDNLVNHMMTRLAAGTQQQVLRELHAYIEIPDEIIQPFADAVEAGRVDPASPDSLAQMIHDSPWHAGAGVVSSIFFGTPDGEFTGMGVDTRDRNAAWTFLRASVTQTQGRMQYVVPNPDGSLGTEGELGAAFQPQVRPWFRLAVGAEGQPVWTDVYANADDGASVITRSRALYSKRGELLGVIGVDLFFYHLQEFLESQSVGENGEVFIHDGSAVLLAAHAPDSDELPFSPRRPLPADQLRFTRAASLHVRQSLGGFTELIEPLREQVTLDGDDGFLYVAPVGRDQGLDWSLGVFLPRSDYDSPSLLRLLPLLLLIALLIWLSMTVFINLMVKPLLQLRESARRIATGDFDTRVDVHCTNEIGQLARAVDEMRLNLKSSFAELSCQKRRAESTLGAITDGVITVDEAGELLYMNAAASRLTGVAFKVALGRPVDTVFRAVDAPGKPPMSTQAVLDLYHDHHKAAREISLLGPGGVPAPVHCRVSMIERQETAQTRIVIVFRDLSAERRLESELLHHATHDGLTDLVNRREFKRRLGVAIESARRHDLMHVVCFIDLDRFKVVNDTCGHAAGDELLKQLARRFVEKLAPDETIARLGGDEFGVLLENCSMDQAVQVMRKLHDHLAGFRFQWQNRSFNTAISSGLAIIDRTTSTAAEIMREADGACYCAKEKGRNQLHVYQEDDEKLSQRRGELRWLAIIEQALDAADGFLLYAQCICRSNATSLQAHHFEVLLRLRNAAGEIVSPARFLPAAERYGLASQIDRWVVNHTLQWLAGRPELASSIELCSINLSGQSVGEPDFQDFLLTAIDTWQVPATQLCFEITETASIANLSLATQLISTLQARGCRFALDDFGSGLSSFAYLKSLRVDYLKIDGVFVRDIGDNPLDLAMVRSINEVGHIMGMQTIAEFVETPAVAAQLRGLKVDFLQGFSIGMPMPIDEFFAQTGHRNDAHRRPVLN